MTNIYKIETDPYKFDTDLNGFPALSKSNVRRINFLIENDSNYRSDRDENNIDSTYNFIRNHPYTLNYEEVLGIIERIDRQNSTHQASEGPGGGNRGREKTARFICKITDFYSRLKEEDPALVNEIAEGAIPTRHTFSFASKICTYVSRYLLEIDGYSIYDNILCNIIPYYAWVYIKEKYKSRLRSNVDKKFGEKGKGDYKGYRELIDRIRFSAKEKTDYLISREDFDHLLWYYFKGDSDLKGSNGTLIHQSRITTALEHVGKTESLLF